MKQFLSASTTALALFVLPVFAFAQIADGEDAGQIADFLTAFLGFINTILLPLILGLAFLMFVWGVFKFFILGGSDEEQQSKGKDLMIYAVAGFVLILSFYGIVNIVVNGLFGTNPGDPVDVPNVPQTIAP